MVWRRHARNSHEHGGFRATLRLRASLGRNAPPPTGNLLCMFARMGCPMHGLGLSVGRRLGAAVQRNRLKRLIREAFRLEAGALPAGFDLVCIPRPDSGATLEDYRASIESVTARALARYRAAPATKTEPPA